MNSNPQPPNPLQLIPKSSPEKFSLNTTFGSNSGSVNGRGTVKEGWDRFETYRIEQESIEGSQRNLARQKEKHKALQSTSRPCVSFWHYSKTKRTRPTDRTVDRVQSNFKKRTVTPRRRRGAFAVPYRTSYRPSLKHVVQKVLFSVNRTMSLDIGTRAIHNTNFVPVDLKGRHQA